MQVIKKARNLGIRATDERQTELKQAALDRRITVQRLFELAMDRYLQGPTPKGNVPAKTNVPGLKNVTENLLSPEETECYDNVRAILQIGKPVKIAMLREFLAYYRNIVEKERGDSTAEAARTEPAGEPAQVVGGGKKDNPGPRKGARRKPAGVATS